MKTKCAIYCRVSGPKQNVKRQINILEEFAKEKGWDIYKTYIDEAYSGKLSIEDRPEFKRLFKDVVRQKFNIILSDEQDRITRTENRAERGLMEQTFIDNNIKLYSPTGGETDLTTLGGEITASMKFIIGSYELKRIKERTSSGRDEHIKNKTRYFGEVPYGYRAVKDEKTGKNTCEFIRAEEEVKVIQRIFSLYVDEHLSYKGVAKKLNDDAVPTKSASKGYGGKNTNWHAIQVMRTLKEEAYTGVTTHNKRKKQSKLKFPEIISPKLFERTKERIKFAKSKAKKTHYGAEEKWLASDVLYCGECGYKLQKDRQTNNGKDYFYYVCQSRKKSKCILKNQQADYIDEEVFEQIARALANPDKHAEQWFKDQDRIELKTQFENWNKKVASKQKSQELLENSYRNEPNKRKYNKLFDLWDKGDDELEDYERKLSIAEQDYNEYQNKNDQLKAYKKAVKLIGHRAKLDYEQNITQLLYGLPFDEKKRVINAVVQPVNMKEGGHVYVRYLRPDDVADMFDKPKHNKPLKDQEPVIIYDHNMDLGKISAIVNGLNKTPLLKYKECYCRNPRRKIGSR